MSDAGLNFGMSDERIFEGAELFRDNGASEEANKS
jgi:hypothetical protein